MFITSNHRQYSLIFLFEEPLSSMAGHTHKFKAYSS